MKKLAGILSIVAMAFVLLSIKSPETATTYNLKIKVYGLRNSKGRVQFALYNKNGTIPDEKFKKCIQRKVGEIEKKGSTTTFYNLPKGKYAVNIFHDENKNGKIDKGWVLPIEGIGFSNFNSIGLSNRPNFKKASFYVGSNTSKTIKVIYM
ncbi:MAG: hypothetical protein ACJA0U_001355 [Salibacteraceae bacterium]|jgi:uncharacterized protein (DUF2141 family)